MDISGWYWSLVKCQNKWKNVQDILECLIYLIAIEEYRHQKLTLRSQNEDLDF